MRALTTSAARTVAVLSLLLLGACAGSSSHMRDVPTGEATYESRSDQALLVFMRPSGLGYAVESSVFEITEGEPEFLGIVSAKTKLARYLPPGNRRFMVIGESADFMDASLHAGKAYYARVAPRIGVWKSRFSLRPVHREDLKGETFAGWYADTRWVENGPSAKTWARDNADSIREKMDDDLPDWLAKSDKPILVAGDGLETPYRKSE